MFQLERGRQVCPCAAVRAAAIYAQVGDAARQHGRRQYEWYRLSVTGENVGS